MSNRLDLDRIVNILDTINCTLCTCLPINLWLFHAGTLRFRVVATILCIIAVILYLRTIRSYLQKRERQNHPLLTTEDMTIYVDCTYGSDNNSGLTPEYPMLTLRGALNRIPSKGERKVTVMMNSHR